jgi:alpha-glucoside transport system permease protein
MQIVASSWSEIVNSSASKFGQMFLMLAVFFGVLLVVFFAAGRATGRFQRPVAVLVFLGPAVLLLIVGLLIPAIRTVYYSLYNSTSTNFVGAKNYEWALTTPGQQRVLINTLLWIVIAPLVSTAFGLVLALLSDRMRGRSEAVTKSLIFMPMAISFVGASIIWKFVYDYKAPSQPQIGLLNQILMALGWDNPPNWLLSQPWNTFLLMVIMIWVQTGFAMVVLSAAIKAIPADITEAAQLDGADGWRLFRRVTIPMIRGTLVVVVTTIMIAVLKIFDIVRTMTGGNFGTSVVANEMFSQTFVQADNGRGSALAVILFIGVVPLIYYNVRVLRKERRIR